MKFPKSKKLTESDYAKLANDLRVIVSPVVDGRTRRDGKIYIRELDGKPYCVQPFASAIRVYSTSQLRSGTGLLYAGDEKGIRRKCVETELIRRGALVKHS